MRAQETRPKLIDISGREVHPVVPTDEEPYTLLDQTLRDIRGAHFVGKGDKELVWQMPATLQSCYLLLLISMPNCLHRLLLALLNQVQQMLAELE